MTDRREELEKRLQATFRLEAAEHLQAINAELDLFGTDMAAQDVRPRLESLFRTMHTLKGAARSVGLLDIEMICNRCEALLRELTKNQRPMQPTVPSVLREAADGLAALTTGALPPEQLGRILANLDAVWNTVPSPAAPATPQPAPSAQDRKPPEGGTAPEPNDDGMHRPSASGRDSIRVEVDRLDHLVTLTEDLLGPKLGMGEHARAARGMFEDIRQLRAALSARGRTKDGWDGGAAIAEIDGTLKSIEARAQRLTLALANDQKALRTTVDDLVEESRRARMMPAASMLEAFPRMVRDLCRETGKEIAWRTSGTDVEVDRKVLDLIKDPLIHLVRNAVDHGIESPSDRVASGKPRQGLLSVGLRLIDDGRVSIEVSDDGRGFSIDDIGEAAIRSRASTAEEIAGFTEDEILDLAFRGGVSTSPVISSISGHGLGLSIVRERVERLDGRVRIVTSPGKGTSIRIEMPTSIATHRGLLVRVTGQAFLWPIDSVTRVIGVHRDAAGPALGANVLVHDGEALPFVRLASTLGLPARHDPEGLDEALPCVIVRESTREAAFLVDEVAGEFEVLIKELQPPLRRVRNIAAAGLLGTGELVLVLRPSDLLSSMHATDIIDDKEPAPAELATRRILVVDDSITTRTMERNLFETAGYAVRVAADGIEAWNILQTEQVDLVVSDIDMPRMDGFELTTRIRSDRRTSSLPVVLVTALEAREDKEKGIRVGANAYVLKSTFAQSNLLEIVGRLI